MKKTYLFIIVILILISLPLSTQPVQAQVTPQSDNSDQGLCLPGSTDILNFRDCSNAGPARRLEDLADKGITFPPQPLPVTKVPAELGNVEFSYAQVSNEEVPTYSTLEEAIEGKPSGSLARSRIKYVSLIQKEQTDKGTFYLTSNNKWLSSDVITKVGVQFFQGYVFNQNPTVDFGWILSEATSRKSPSINAEETGNQYFRYNIIHIYDSKMEGEIEWVMIGPDEWIDHRVVSRVSANYEKPAGVNADRWIEINLYEQVLIVHEKDRIVFATLISTGVDPFFTQPGVFTIYKKLEHDYMRGAFEADKSDFYYLEDVPYIMYYDQSRALHGAYWHTRFGYQQSHGCVNLSIADSHWIYDWANEGDYVYVWDPSGKTPTDPAVYGAGGI